MRTRIVWLWMSVPLVLSAASVAAAAPTTANAPMAGTAFVLDAGDPWPADVQGDLPAPSLRASVDALGAEPDTEAQATQPRPMAFEYSDGYRVRLKIHKYASIATVPLFIAQYVVGQKLYDGNASDGTRSAHSALAATTGVLFGVNTVTGVWNWSEGRKDPNKKTKKTLHSVLMLAADAGFVATGALAPDDEEGQLEGGGNRSTHRTVALVSMGIATVSYLIMLLGN